MFDAWAHPDLLANGLGSWDWFARNWAFFAITTTIVLLVIVPACVVARYIRLMLNMVKDTPLPFLPGVEMTEQVSGEEVTFPAFDGHALRGMLIEGNRSVPRKGLIVFCHEFGSDMHSCSRYAKPLIESGYDIFTFDFRNHGCSSRDDTYEARQWTEEREVADVMGVYAHVRDHLESEELPAGVGVLGISRGAAAAMLAAESAPIVKCFMTDGVFSTDAAWEYFMKRWAYLFAKVRFVYENHPPQFWKMLRWILERCTKRALNCRYPSVRRAVARMGPTPWFIVHGQRDSYLPLESARDLYDLASEPKYMWLVPGSKHNQAVLRHPEEYARRTVAFFDRHLAGIDEGAVAFPRDLAESASA